MLRKEKGERWLSIFDSERKLRTDEVKEGGERKKKAMSRSDGWGGGGGVELLQAKLAVNCMVGSSVQAVELVKSYSIIERCKLSAGSNT